MLDIRQLEWDRLTGPAPLDVPTGDVDEDGIFEASRIVQVDVMVLRGGDTESFIGGRNSLTEAEIADQETVKRKAVPGPWSKRPPAVRVG